jgi:hypothetical protein
VTLARHALIVAAVLAVTLIGGGLLAGGRVSAAAAEAAVFGATVAAANAILAHVLVLRTAGRPASVFLKLVIGGMAGRIALVLGAVAVAVGVLSLPGLPLVLSLIGHFAVFLGLEIVSLNAMAPLGRLDGTR